MKEILATLIYPAPITIVGLIILMFVDLLTGINKASANKEATTSRGLRKTFDKASTYLSAIVSLLVIINITHFADKEQKFYWLMDYSATGIMIFTCYIEFKSILENLIAINTIKGKPNDFAKFILIKLHDILIVKLNKNKENE
jgi:hypothetical protein